MKFLATILLGFFLMSSCAFAAIKTQTVDYKTADGSTMEGYLAYDDKTGAARPGILIVPDWMGVSTFTKNKAEELAKQGYIAFATDVYGKGIRPSNNDEAGQLATKYKNDRALLRTRMRAAYDELIKLKQVNPNKIVVMGYCFGGTAALELARSGVTLAGTATFHGGLSNPNPQDAKNIKGGVLIMHGADDPFVSPDEVAAFKKEMNDAHIAFTFIAYPGAVHAFTIPTAGNYNNKGAAYNAAADKASWNDFEVFLKKVLD